jgi:hypothetical protein
MTLRSALHSSAIVAALAFTSSIAFAGSPQGAPCSQNTDCTSAFCTDGVCCDEACSGDCQACSVSRGLAVNGTCAFAPEGTSGRNPCANGFACNGKSPACAVTCTDDASCAAGYYCDAAGACAPQKAASATCNEAAGKDCLTSGCRECSVGNCVDGACCATCQGSDALGATCTNDGSCESNHCVGGTCCQNSCGSVGDAGVSSICTAAVCSAVSGFTCILPGPETLCRAESCVNGVMAFAATCSGDGACASLETETCAPYACNSNGATCNNTCASNTDCATGSSCNTQTQTCVTGATCSTDRTTVIGITGQQTSCVPFACVGGACAAVCGNDQECATGYSCQSSRCLAVNDGGAPVVTSSSGCQVSRSREDGWLDATFAAAIGFAAIAFARRRRRSAVRR